MKKFLHHVTQAGFRAARGREAVEFRAACGWPPVPHGPRLTAWLAAQDAAPLLPEIDLRTAPVLDYTVSIFGRCECSETTTSIPAAAGSRSSSLRSCSTWMHQPPSVRRHTRGSDAEIADC